ncbi:LysR family transcriptional regulator [Caballeronia sordidicola]|uniref:LysR family transcriptional regulator n=1 Tax=Caballeronia sordidicola TaxID=196367 RepID=UPI000A3C7D80|nr:LysR family transcriptional regulator [Caballeronia sordidicola]
MQQFDFNLLVALDVLLQESSVRKAAERLHLSPAAMSHTLGRLRVAMGDPILVRAGQRLVPTPRALAVHDRVRQLVSTGHSVFQNRGDEELRDVNRRFTIRADDSMIAVLACDLMEHVLVAAPNIQVRFAGRLDEEVGPLRDGSVDLDIGVAAKVGPEINSQRLMEDEFVGVVRAEHPCLTGKLSIGAYVAMAHVVASRKGRTHGPVDVLLSSTGLARNIQVVVPDTLSAIIVAAGSDLIATVPKSIAEWGIRTMSIVSLALPFKTPSVTIYQSWHPRSDADAAHRWLRASLLATVRARTNKRTFE